VGEGGREGGLVLVPVPPPPPPLPTGSNAGITPKITLRRLYGGSSCRREEGETNPTRERGEGERERDFSINGDICRT